MINVSIVLYESDFDNIKPTIQSVLNSELVYKLIIIDNSSSDNISGHLKDSRIFYLLNNKNVGFGAAHNIAIKKLSGSAKYHLVLNPDVCFEKGTLEKLFNFMENEKDVGLVMPKVLYPDGALQYLCRLLPTPCDLICRKLNNKIFNCDKYELKFADHDKIMDVPYLSGCFMFIRDEVFKKVGVFDERLFVYFEDVDLSRRIHKLYRTIFYPGAVICHGYQRGSNKDVRLFKNLIVSSIKYFNKWGWFFDKERKIVNREILKNIPRVPNN